MLDFSGGSDPELVIKRAGSRSVCFFYLDSVLKKDQIGIMFVRGSFLDQFFLENRIRICRF